MINEKAVRLVHVTNAGSSPLEFEWTGDGDESHLIVSPSKGRVAAGERAAVEICYQAAPGHKLKAHPVVCKIVGGPAYTLAVSAAAHRPKLHMSFALHDFGRVFRFQEGAQAITKELMFRNDDTQVCCSPSLPVCFLEHEVAACLHRAIGAALT